MSDTVNLVGVRAISGVLKTALLDPPAWTRLEPISATGDPAPGLEARVHDPLWLLARQWQFGEFTGEDAGTPIGVHLALTSRRIDAWQPGDAGDRPALPLPPGTPLETEIEREPVPVFGVGLRQRAEAGSLLVKALADAGFDSRAALLAQFPLPLDAPAPEGIPPDAWKVPRSFKTIARSSPDGEAAAASLEAAGGAAPAWLAGAPPAAMDEANAWLAWYRSRVAPRDATDASWIPERLEYRFAVRAGSGQEQLVFRAPLHDGGPIDWFTFDAGGGGPLVVPNEQPGGEPPISREATVLATPLHYAGQPADRLWQYEDGAVNFGKMEIQAHDPARLCLVEFATVYGNDWFVVPLDVHAGTFTVLGDVSYTTTFGERFTVPPADDRGRSGRFRMFEVSKAGSDESIPGLLLAPSARGFLEGRALEEVLFLRDETANMAWAIEKTVQGAAGDPRDRGDEPRVVPETGPLEPGTELAYVLETAVPPNWIPLVPVPTTGRGGFVLRKGTMTDKDQSIGALLDPTPLTIKEEEVPREGVRLSRVPALARASDGRILRWVARRVAVGRGEGSSALAFDAATR